MKLKSLHLHGFKSFPDRTALEFRDGVTAVIGSNGCGKSNLADAIRWVLGEQRASVMRGARMDEVIFQGTVRRRPLNFAEVSLLFDNQSGRIPVPQTEIEVARKVFREGGSEYSLNQTACRLRDVHGLLRDTGLGANAYAIIESTMIETLLSDRADERRMLFEEAAGIGKYKDSRQAATRRLQAAEADLTRLDDLLAEVESKVRALSRQRRKAERHRELQARRLDLEIAIARKELERLEDELRRAVQRRDELDEEGRSAGAERITAEAVVEERRIEAAELGRQRTQRAGALESIRAKLDAHEREVLLADERRSNAEARLAQLANERVATLGAIAGLEKEIADAGAERGAAEGRAAEARARAESRTEENAGLRQSLAEQRAMVEAAAARARELAREIATAEGGRAAAERQLRDGREGARQTSGRIEQLRQELMQITDQTELWETRADEIRDRVEASREAVEAAREEVVVLRGRANRARDEARQVEDHASKLTAQIEAREALERSYEGFAPAVAFIMSRRADFPGVHGPLADFLASRGDSRLAAIEAFLGPLLQALVVDDLATARAVRRWFHEEWSEGGSLLLLPLEALDRAPAATDSSRGAGAPWVDALLADLVVVEGDALDQIEPGRARIGDRGDVIDSRGVVRLSRAGKGQGILARREALAALRQELRETLEQQSARERERDDLRARLEAAEEGSLEAEEALRAAESQLKGLQLDTAAHQDLRARLQQERAALEANLAELGQAVENAEIQLAALEQRLDELSQAVEEATSDEDAARGRLSVLEAEWDRARDAESELRIDLARVESDLRESQRRLEAAEQSLAVARARIVAIDEEGVSIRSQLEGLSDARGRAAAAIEKLFRERDEETGALALVDARLAEVDSELAELGERARASRRRETEAAESRHRLDLQISENQSRMERVRERIEVEWGRPWSALAAQATADLEGDLDSWRRELRETTEQLESLGAVNMLAVEEHEEEDRRLEFLRTQRKDLVEARDDLLNAIRQINQTAREVFQSTFDAVRVNFKRTFQSLFQGGQCDIWLADPDDPLEAAVEIQASPVGKKTQRIHLLSGGERTLTALALLFALYLVKPSPFCVLDEIDAPLDESNVGRFIQLLHDFKTETQFIVITHHPRTMEAADWVYGVTMEEPGVSSIVGVELVGEWVQNGKVETSAS